MAQVEEERKKQIAGNASHREEVQEVAEDMATRTSSRSLSLPFLTVLAGARKEVKYLRRAVRGDGFCWCSSESSWSFFCGDDYP